MDEGEFNAVLVIRMVCSKEVIHQLCLGGGASKSRGQILVQPFQLESPA